MPPNPRRRSGLSPAASAARAFAAAGLLGLLAACGGGGSTPTPIISSKPQAFPAPDFAAFLRNPVATPTACPPHQLGSSTGLASPWVGHVDISVFIDPKATAKQIAAIGAEIRRAPHVSKVYYESQTQAAEEFRRLYTCWANVPASQTPASYRIAIDPTTRIDARNVLVVRLHELPNVDAVDCDPSLPCTNLVGAATPTP